MEEKIVLYASDTCPQCKMLKMQLDQKKVQYTVNKNIDELITKGFSSYPVLQVGDQFMKLKDALAWLKERK